MKQYQIKYTTQSTEDMGELFKFIFQECSAPLTARRYMEGIKEEVDRLEFSAEAIAKDIELSCQMGLEVRRTHYKKVTIIYSVEDDVVYVHRIMPQSMIIF